MLVYFLRHASAGEKYANPKKDEKRPLDAEGIQQCGLIGRALNALDVQVDVIITSPLKRATQTAAAVANELGNEGKLQMSAALRPEATFDQFRELLQQQAHAEAIMVVGHNPNLSEFLGRLVSRPGGRAGFDLKKGGVARVELRRGGGQLHWCITPKLVRSVQAAAADSSRPKTSRK
jgi:phosphohistidine phosphatase